MPKPVILPPIILPPTDKTPEEIARAILNYRPPASQDKDVKPAAANGAAK